jgi:hypothetical protein
MKALVIATFILLSFGGRHALAQCRAVFTENTYPVTNKSVLRPKGMIWKQEIFTRKMNDGSLEETVEGPTQVITTQDGNKAVCFWKDYCYPAKSILLEDCKIVPGERDMNYIVSY